VSNTAGLGRRGNKVTIGGDAAAWLTGQKGRKRNQHAAQGETHHDDCMLKLQVCRSQRIEGPHAQERVMG
jgi:hypothetical protein